MPRSNVLPTFFPPPGFPFLMKDTPREMVPTCSSSRVSVSCGEKMTRFEILPAFFSHPGFPFFMERKTPREMVRTCSSSSTVNVDCVKFEYVVLAKYHHTL